MSKWLCVIALAALLSPASVSGSEWQGFGTPVEVRAIWVDAGAIPKTAVGIRQLVQAYHAAGINLLFPETIARGYAIYESKLLARDPRFKGYLDPLPVFIHEAHRLGMEVHPWVWVFRAGYTKDRGAILGNHPEWAELSSDGKELSPNGGYWISPCIEPARDFLAGLFAELVSNYEVDGLHLDYVRYEAESAASYGYCQASLSVFARQYGFDPRHISPYTIDHYQWNKFRERQINTFVQRIALQTRRLKPRAILSAAVGPETKSARIDLLQNWMHWTDNKWLDFVVPMAYSNNDQHFQRLLASDLAAARGQSLVVAGIGLNTRTSAQQVSTQISLARQSIALGQAFFSASYFSPEYALALKSAYPGRAELPFRDTPKKIQQLRDTARTTKDSQIAGYLTALADALAEYADYRDTPAVYVLPTPPPFTVRD